MQAWLAKEDERFGYYKNRVNAGLHVISPKMLEQCGLDGSKIGAEDESGKIIKADLGCQFLEPLSGSGLMVCYDSPEYVKDMETLERYYSVVEDYKNGIVQLKNLKNM